MNIFLKCLEQRISELEKVLEEKEVAVKNAPGGRLAIANNGKKIHYYQVTNVRTYLKESETQTVKDLCQKGYDQKVFVAAQKELDLLKRLHSNYPIQTYEDIYDKLNEYRKGFVQPIMISDEEYIKEWESIEYNRKGFLQDAPEYYTNRGERVRSKTEILIANALENHKIPYRYEYPIYLNGYGKIHPDFTVLNVRLRKEIYWEHLGMMDNQEYAQEALRRIDMYERNDIFPGDVLIITHETGKYPMGSKMIDNMIRKYLV